MTGCATSTPILNVVAAFPCADLVPAAYRRPVQGAQPLAVGATLGDAGAAIIEERAGRVIANGRTADVIAIVEACDRRAEKVATALQPKPWWKRMF